MTEHLFRSHRSFRTRALLVSFALQTLFVAVFATAVLFIVADRGGAVLRDNLAAATSGYARNAAFVFIGSLEENRSDFLEAAIGSPDIDAAFLTDPDFELIALTDESRRADIEKARPASGSAGGARVMNGPGYWIFYEPVVTASGEGCEGFSAESRPCAGERELLGYFGVIGSKEIITSLMSGASVVVAGAAVLLLGFIYWATNRLADRLYGPMLDLVDRTVKTADRDYREKLDYSGPPEVEEVARAINHLIDRAGENTDHLEEIVAEKTREEREAREQAEQARAFAEKIKEWRTELMAVNTHELLTPLRILIGELDRALDELRFLEEGRTKDGISRRLALMRAPIRRMEEIVEQVNVAMRIEEGRVDVRLTSETIEPMMKRLESLYAPEANRRRNRLTVENDVDAAIVIDHRMLETIASNLLSNACKFTRDGEIKLSAAAETGMLILACADTGMGIPEARKALIFEPLFQADMSTRRVADGLGLGLSIVKGYVERLHGRIELESGEGIGTRVFVKLPIPAGLQ